MVKQNGIDRHTKPSCLAQKSHQNHPLPPYKILKISWSTFLSLSPFCLYHLVIYFIKDIKDICYHYAILPHHIATLLKGYNNHNNNNKKIKKTAGAETFAFYSTNWVKKFNVSAFLIPFRHDILIKLREILAAFFTLHDMQYDNCLTHQNL